MRRGALTGVIVLVCGALAPCGGASLTAQVGAGVTSHVVSGTDPSVTFATFVPSSYRGGTPAPLMIVLDPRGRALVPLERMAHAAERLGWLLMSSYDSRSDESIEPTERAVAAMIEDAQDLFTIDTNRLYFAGFSGTARSAWLFGQRFVPYTAGILALGAGLPYAALPAALGSQGAFPFAFYGGTGDTDFNWEEVRRLDEVLDDYVAPHFVDEWAGGHAWPPEEVFTRALEWLDTRANLDGLAHTEPGELERRYRAGLELARTLELEGRPDQARRRYESLASMRHIDVDVSEALTAMARLDGSPELARARDRDRDILEERKAFDRTLGAWLEAVRSSGRAREVIEGADALDIDELLERGRDDSDPYAARAARRRLAAIRVRTAFYEPAAWLESDDFAVAEAYYRIAARIAPEDPAVQLGIARTSAQLGRIDQALDALERAAATGAVGREALTGDALLEPLRNEPRYRVVLERLAR